MKTTTEIRTKVSQIVGNHTVPDVVTDDVLGLWAEQAAVCGDAEIAKCYLLAIGATVQARVDAMTHTERLRFEKRNVLGLDRKGIRGLLAWFDNVFPAIFGKPVSFLEEDGSHVAMMPSLDGAHTLVYNSNEVVLFDAVSENLIRRYPASNTRKHAVISRAERIEVPRNTFKITHRDGTRCVYEMFDDDTMVMHFRERGMQPLRVRSRNGEPIGDLEPVSEKLFEDLWAITPDADPEAAATATAHMELGKKVAAEA